MRIRRRTNLLLGLAFFAVALAILLRTMNILPDGIYDLLLRASPILLVLFGLSIFLRSRVPFGSLIAVVLSVALVAGAASMSFSTRAAQQREDFEQAVQQQLPEDLTLLRVQIETLNTNVEVIRSSNNSINGRFLGSTESQLEINLVEGGDTTATFTLRETQPSPFPMLEAVGRGTLQLEIPAGIALDVSFIGADGNVTLSLNGLALERLNLNLVSGDAVVTLPEYNPVGTPDTETLGTLAVRNGNLTLIIPTTVAAHLELNRGGSGILPEYPANYNYLQGDILESRVFDSAEITLRYVITAPGGLISLRESSG